MRDITGIIKEVIATDIAWPINFFFEAIEKLSKTEFEISFWKDEENWASMYVENAVIGYVWSKHPLVFITSQYAGIVKEHLKDCSYITFIEVASLFETEFRLNYNELKDEIDFGLSDDGFSAEDLWFYTNSR